MQRLILNPLTRNTAAGWIDEGRLKAQTLPVGFWKVLAFHPAWEGDPWVNSLRGSGPAWAGVTQPANDEHTPNPRPTIKADMASLGDVDPNSVQMRISGLGLVPAKYDAQSKSASYQVTQNLIPRAYTVIISAKAQGRRVETRWNFTVDQSASATPAAPAPNKQAGTRM